MYLKDPYVMKRLKTRTVGIGNLPLGKGFPVRIQSMTNTLTSDIKATVDQSRRLFEAGCDYVRITARNISEAKKLETIRKQLHADGFDKPLIADIHFNPDVALVAARIVEKVRINPGNYIGTKDKSADWLHMKESAYNAELDLTAARLRPLIDVCREYGTAIRIGTNHGSLSKRILARYGNTPDGMVQSAMEFIRIISSQGFHNLVLSMKASDIRIMISAYRLLVSRMNDEGFDYPLHLGVTEAGAGESGIIRSAAGIGALLADGIGDTIRVSLTGDPVQEVPVAIKLGSLFRESQTTFDFPQPELKYDPFTYSKRITAPVGPIGGGNPVMVMNNAAAGTIRPDFVFSEELNDDSLAKTGQYSVVPHQKWVKGSQNMFPYFENPDAYGCSKYQSEVLNFVAADGPEDIAELVFHFRNGRKIAAVVTCDKNHEVGLARYLIHKLITENCTIPVILRSVPDKNDSFIDCAASLSALLTDGYGDGIWIDGRVEPENQSAGDFAFGLLQSHGLRRTRAEFVSCPTCGRTSFDVEKVLEQIRLKAGSFSHLKIAVMGCIVNGPGEMADADYGCVGTGQGKVNIYKGKDVIMKNIPEADAADHLLQLISRHTDPE